MISIRHIAQYLQRYPAIGAAAYVSVILALLATCWLCVAGVVDQRANLTTAQDILAQLQRRFPASQANAADGAPRGSPFLQGQTITVAGAGLLRQVSVVVTRVGGRVLSSQVDLQAAQAKPGFISVIVNCELDQPGLQKLLYDLESGMPFLFVDQLAVRASEASGAQAGRMHVLLSAAGQWVSR